jgi:hypothetical protein
MYINLEFQFTQFLLLVPLVLLFLRESRYILLLLLYFTIRLSESYVNKTKTGGGDGSRRSGDDDDDNPVQLKEELGPISREACLSILPSMQHANLERCYSNKKETCLSNLFHS